MIEVPEVVRAKARTVGAEAWLDELPGIVDDLAEQWDVEVGAVFTDATEAFVAAATTSDGAPVVMKVLVPRASNDAQYEVTALRLAAGRGCVELLAHDEDRGALLLERLGPSMRELGLPFTSRTPLLVAAASQVWRPAPGADLPSGADKAAWLAEFVTTTWEELDEPCSESTIHHALECAERRAAAHDDERAVLVHGDVHEWNALQSGDGFKLVDPDGLLAEPEYDLGVLMREDPLELMDGDPHDRARWLARLSGLDPVAIWEWGVVERVSTGLVLTQLELQPVGRQMLEAADAIARDRARPLMA